MPPGLSTPQGAPPVEPTQQDALGARVRAGAGGGEPRQRPRQRWPAPTEVSKVSEVSGDRSLFGLLLCSSRARPWIQSTGVRVRARVLLRAMRRARQPVGVCTDVAPNAGEKGSRNSIWSGMARTHARAHTHTPTCAHVRTSTRLHARKRMHACTPTDMHARMHARSKQTNPPGTRL
jgi:hypothetical protein